MGDYQIAQGEFRAPARVTFFCCQKKVTKENHLDLRFKDPLARCGSCKIGGAGFAELVQRVSLSVRGTAYTSCAAAADNSEGRDWYAGRVGDYQIAPIVVRSAAMGRCALRARGVICLLTHNTVEQKSLP